MSLVYKRCESAATEAKGDLARVRQEQQPLRSENNCRSNISSIDTTATRTSFSHRDKLDIWHNRHYTDIYGSNIDSNTNTDANTSFSI